VLQKTSPILTQKPIELLLQEAGLVVVVVVVVVVCCFSPKKHQKDGIRTRNLLKQLGLDFLSLTTAPQQQASRNGFAVVTRIICSYHQKTRQNGRLELGTSKIHIREYTTVTEIHIM
jgi:hypothetical protein